MDQSHALYLGMLAAMLTPTTSACARNTAELENAGLDCAITGAKFLNADLSDAALCDRFYTNLGPAATRIDSLRFTITPNGSISVRIVTENGDEKDYGIDVMDRAMTLTDFDTLARTVSARYQQ